MLQQSLLLPKVYRIKPRWLIRFLAWNLLLIAFIVTAIWAMFNAPFLPWLPLLLFGLLFLPAFVAALGSRLMLSDAGVTCYVPGASIFTPWHNIAGIRTTMVGVGKWRISRLILREPASKKIKLADGMRQGIAVVKVKRRVMWWIPAGHTYTTSFPLLTVWENDEIEAYLRQYAPRAFEHISPDMDEHIVQYRVRRRVAQAQVLSLYSLSLPKVYSTRTWLKILLLFFSIGGAVLAILTITPAFKHNIADNIIPFIGCLAFAACGLFGYLGQRNCRLVLSPEGLTLYAIGYRMFTPWHNISGFGSTGWLGCLGIRGLMLREAALMKVKLADGMRQGIAVLDTDWWAYPGLHILIRFFPMDSSLCESNWEYGEIGMYLRQYAPQMFAETAADR